MGGGDMLRKETLEERRGLSIGLGRERPDAVSARGARLGAGEAARTVDAVGRQGWGDGVTLVCVNGGIVNWARGGGHGS